MSDRLFAAAVGVHPTQTRTRVEGSDIRSVTTFADRVVTAQADQLWFEGGASMRFVLPAGVDLRPLVGARVDVRLSHTVHAGGAATLDVRLTTEEGLTLWVRDGRPPRVPPRSLPIQADARAMRLGGRRIPEGVHAVLDRFRVLVLRAGARDVAFVAVRR